MKIHENKQRLEAVLFIRESIMTFKTTRIVCVDFWFVFFLCVPCQFWYLCSCGACVSGLKVANH